MFSGNFKPRNQREWSIEVPWGKLALVSFGHPDGEPVLLVHGRQDSCAVFAPLLEHMTPEKHYVALDMPGNGLSDAFPHVSNVPLRPGDYHYAVLFRPPPMPGAQFVKFNKFKQSLHFKPKPRGDSRPKLQRFHFLYAMELVLWHLGWDKFVFMGHSMGCEQGLFYNAIYPGQITMMILLDAGPTLMRMQVEDPHEYQRMYYDSYYENYHKENFTRKTYTRTSAAEALKKLRDVDDEQCAKLLERNFHSGNWHLIEAWHPNEISVRKAAQKTNFLKHDVGRIINMPFPNSRWASKSPMQRQYRVPHELYPEWERFLNERAYPQPEKPNKMPNKKPDKKRNDTSFEMPKLGLSPTRPLSPQLDCSPYELFEYQQEERLLEKFYADLEEKGLIWTLEEPSTSKSAPPSPGFKGDYVAKIHFVGSPRRSVMPYKHVKSWEHEKDKVSYKNPALASPKKTHYFKVMSYESINLEGKVPREDKLFVLKCLGQARNRLWAEAKRGQKPREARKAKTTKSAWKAETSSGPFWMAGTFTYSSWKAASSIGRSKPSESSTGSSRVAGTSAGSSRIRRTSTMAVRRSLATATATLPVERAVAEEEEQRYMKRVHNLIRSWQELGYLSWDNRLKTLAPQNYGNNYYFELFKSIPPTLLIAASDGAKNIPPIPKWHNGAKELLDKMATLENFHRVDVEGSHDVHFTHPERVAPYINEFLKGKVMSKL